MLHRITQLATHLSSRSVSPSSHRLLSTTTAINMSAKIPTSMKALQIQKQGDLDVLELRDIPVPQPGAEDVLFKVEYAGVNFIDTYQRSGLYPLQLPFVLGNEPAGTIVSVGDKVSDLKVGDRVASYTAGGGYAEYAKAPRNKTAKLPEDLATKDGAVALLQGLTAWTLLRESYPVKKGDWILVHAAAGGVGLLLCQMGKHLGAHVIGTTSTEEKAKLAKENGAEHVIVSTKENVVDRVLELTGGEGCAGIYDGIGKDTWEDDFKIIARKGTLCTFGNASGAVPAFPPLKLAAKNIKVCRPTLGNYIFTRQEFDTYSQELFDLLKQGVVKLSVHKEYEFGAEGIKQSQVDITSRGTTGKLVIKL